MEKWNNTIYINKNPGYNLQELEPGDGYIVKIGSSKCLPARYHSYKTYSPVRTELIRYYYIEDYDCYELDEDIKVHLDKYRIHSSGGIEFYYSAILDVLEKYMLDRLIRFTRYDSIDDFPPFDYKMIKKNMLDAREHAKVQETYLAKPLITHAPVLEPVLDPDLDPDIEPAVSVKLVLSDHQHGIMNRAIEHFKSHDKGILNLFCRYGKTRLSAAFTQVTGYARVLILVPSLYLIEQTRKTWVEAFPDRIITISSDASDISAKELELIKCKMSEILTEHDNNAVIVISTYQSSSKLAELEFDLCIYDEAHRTTGDKSKFNQMVSSNTITHKLFLTATMKYYDYIDNEDSGAIITNSMDNPALYGEVIASVSAKEALELKRICPYTVMTMKLQEIEDDENIKKLESTIPQFLEKDLANSKQTKITTPIKAQAQDDATSLNVDNFISQNIKRYIRIALGLIKVIKQYKMRHIITFHKFKKCARLFQYILEYISASTRQENGKRQIINKAKLPFNLDVAYLSGDYSKSERNTIIDEFNNVIKLDNHHKVICNAKVLQEGVDIPRCDAVCFVDIKTSAVDTIQSLARCMTYMENKHAYIIIPFDESDFALDTTNQDLLDIKFSDYAMQLRLLLRNLVEIDDNIKEYFRIFNDREKQGCGVGGLSQDGDELVPTKLNCLIDAALINNMSEIAYEVFTVAKSKINGKYMTPEEYHAKIMADFGGNIPQYPDKVYRGWGWRGWNDYLGIDPYMRPSAVRKLMHAVNTQRTNDGMPMIETAAAYREYAKANNLMVELRPPHDNWCWLLLPDYDSLVVRYYTTKEEIQEAIKKRAIRSIKDYEEKQPDDARLAPYKMLAAGFYNERIPSIGKNISNFITDIYSSNSDDCFF